MEPVPVGVEAAIGQVSLSCGAAAPELGLLPRKRKLVKIVENRSELGRVAAPVTQKRATEKEENPQGVWQQTALENSYYTLLGLHPSASVIEIRRAYRELSKRYHPDTTELPQAIATEKFQKLNEAYATLSNPERRMAYDQKIRYSRIPVIQPPVALNRPVSQQRQTQHSSAYLDPTDRPLSAGEIFALFILGVTFLGCLLIAIAIGLTRGEATLEQVGFNTTPSTVLVREITQDVPALQLLSLPKGMSER